MLSPPVSGHRAIEMVGPGRPTPGGRPCAARVVARVMWEPRTQRHPNAPAVWGRTIDDDLYVWVARGQVIITHPFWVP